MLYVRNNSIHMHKLVKIPGIVNNSIQLNSYAAHSAFGVRRKQYAVHQIMSWRYSVYPGIVTHDKRGIHVGWERTWSLWHLTFKPGMLGVGWGGVVCVNRTTRSGCVPEQVWTGHRPETGTVPVNFSRCERYTNEWNGTGTGPEREPEQVWTGPKWGRITSTTPWWISWYFACKASLWWQTMTNRIGRLLQRCCYQTGIHICTLFDLIKQPGSSFNYFERCHV